MMCDLFLRSWKIYYVCIYLKTTVNACITIYATWHNLSIIWCRPWARSTQVQKASTHTQHYYIVADSSPFSAWPYIPSVLGAPLLLALHLVIYIYAITPSSTTCSKLNRMDSIQLIFSASKCISHVGKKSFKLRQIIGIWFYWLPK